MGWREKADKLKTAAMEGAERLNAAEKTQQAKEAAASGIDRVRNSEAVAGLDAAAIKDAAVQSAAVTDRHGKTKLWRVARAAANPMGTATRVAKAVGMEAHRQHRESPKSDSADGAHSLMQEAEAAADGANPETRNDSLGPRR